MTTFGVLFGILVFPFLLLLAAPLYAGFFANKPGVKRRSDVHFFTYPEEGKAKIIVRGDVVVRMVMLYAGHIFANEDPNFSRGLTNQDKEYWEIKDIQKLEGVDRTAIKMTSPLAGIHPLILPWAKYVYWTTGLVFTGIFPYQSVREELLERTEILHEESGDKTNLVLKVKRDYSDHLRVREFLYPIRIAKADTQDKIPVNVLLVIKAQVTNPHKAAYGVDRWDQQLVNMTTNAVTNFTRTRNLDAVLTAKDTAEATAINEAIRKITEDQTKYGFEINGVEIIDISPNLTPEENSKLRAEALAKPVAEATRIDGKARADNLRELNEANKVGGKYAIETMRTEALVRAARGVPVGSTVLLSTGEKPSDSDISSATLAELKKLNANLEKTGGTQ